MQIQEIISSDSNVTSSTLTIVPQLEDGGQIITCKAENPFMSSRGDAGNGGKLSPSSLDELMGQTDSANQEQHSGAHIEDFWKLDVHYLPRVKLALGDKLNGNIREGHDVYFECSVNAHPVAHEIRWWFEGRELEANVTSGIIISNQSLVLQRVNRNQRGRYTCSALNSIGESQSNSVHLRVQYAPFCRDPSSQQSNADGQSSNGNGNSINRVAPPADDVTLPAVSQLRHKTHYGAARLEPVKVYCHVDADPSDSLTYRWAFLAGSQKSSASEGNKIDTDSQVSPIESSKQQQQLVYLDPSVVEQPDPMKNQLVSVATYTPRSELDYGTLLCWAQNSLGQQAEPCTYQVVPAERPDPVRNCRLLNASDIQLTVACEPGYDGGIDQSFYMEVYDSRRHELVANVSNAPISLMANKPLGNSVDLSGGSWLEHKNSTGNLNVHSHDDHEDQPQTGGQSASLVSELQQGNKESRQHRQWNSMQPQSDASSVASIDSSQDAIFVTERNLRPATDYFLSIYSANSRGPSKPVAFTATTASHLASSSSSSSSQQPFDAATTSSQRGGRRADSSHLISDVLGLSWNPFLIVCAITIGLFVLFATVTFALMKYIDFSAANFSSNGNGNGGCGGGGNCSKRTEHRIASSLAATNATTATYAPCLSSAGSSSSGCGGASGSGSHTTNRSMVGGCSVKERVQESEYNIELEDMSEVFAQQQHGEADYEGDEEEITDAVTLSKQATTDNNRRSKLGSKVGGHIVQTGSGAPKTLAVAATTGATTSTGGEMPLNGIPASGGQKLPSILNGSYLRTKIQQLASGLSPQHQQNQSRITQAGKVPVGGNHYQMNQTSGASGMRQSNSDNYLNNLDSNWQQAGQSSNEMSFLNQQHEMLAYHQQATAYCAGTLPRNLPSQQMNHTTHQMSHFQQNGQPLALQTFDPSNPYSTRQSDLLANYGLDSSLMLAPAASRPNENNIYSRQPSGQQPVEHLVISGKQYIHQTSASNHLHRNSAHRSSYAGMPSSGARFGGNQAVKHQLQVTSVATPLPPPTGLLAGSDIVGYMHQQQQLVSNSYQIEGGNPLGEFQFFFVDAM